MSAKPSHKPAPLGRGLSALFGDTDSSYAPPAARQDSKAPAPVGAVSPEKMAITWIRPGTYQPRRRFDEDAIAGLAASIKEKGVLQPLMVRPVAGEKNSYEIIAGERRWRAAQRAGVHEVPVFVREMSDQEAMEIGLIENVQRQDLSPLEEAEGYKRLLEEFHHTQDGLAKIVGKSRPHITNLLRLLTLPSGVKAMIDEGQLTMGHARTLVTAQEPEKIAAEIVKKGLSVRQAEALARRAVEGTPAKAKKESKTSAMDADLLSLEKDIESLIGLKARIKTEGAGGSLTFFFTDLDQLDDLLKRLRM